MSNNFMILVKLPFLMNNYLKFKLNLKHLISHNNLKMAR